jgi:hypothetical protein
MGALRRPFLKKIGAGAGALLMGHSGYELLGNSSSSDSGSGSVSASDNNNNNNTEFTVSASFLPRGKNQTGFNSGETNWNTGVEDDYTDEIFFDERR